MYSCLRQIRETLKQTVQTLLKDIPDIRIAIIAHGIIIIKVEGEFECCFQAIWQIQMMGTMC
jgi:hypothetical protein